MTTEHQLAQNLITQAKEQGLDLSSDTLLKTLTQDIIQAALDEELTDHLGYPKHAENPNQTSQNTRNGYRTKRILTDTVGPIDIKVPRDRDGSKTSMKSSSPWPPKDSPTVTSQPTSSKSMGPASVKTPSAVSPQRSLTR